MLQILSMVCCSFALLLNRMLQITLDNESVLSIINAVYSVLLYLFLILYIFSWLHLCRVFYVIYGSLYHLRKKRFLKYTKPIAWIYEKFFHKEFYEKNYRPRVNFEASPIPGVDSSIFQKVICGGTILLLYDDEVSYSPVVTNFVKTTITANETIDYITTYKSPLDLCNTFSGNEIVEVTKRLSVIDCFTSHYGFDDKVVKFAKQDLMQKGFVFFDAASFSEVHTAANNSWYRFRKVCEKEENSFRIPHRTVYDTLSSLIRFSSEELYLLFLRHVIFSEKSYGMISLIIEPSSLSKELKGDLVRMADIVLVCKSSGISVMK